MAAIISVADPTVVIDNGHGRNTAGKRTPLFPKELGLKGVDGNFMHEWEFNRATAVYLKKELIRCGFKVVEASPTEDDTSITARAKKANAAKADFLISIHANALAGTWGKAKGVETLVYPSTKSKAAGKVIQEELVKASGLTDRGLKDGAWLGILKGSTMPGVLVECGFMDNLEEAKLLMSTTYRKKVAVGLAKAICEIFGKKYVAESKEPEATVTKQDAGKIYRVQVGAFGAKSNADNLSKELTKKGIQNFVVLDGKFYKVQAGAFSVKANAEAYAKKVNKLGYNTMVSQ